MNSGRVLVGTDGLTSMTKLHPQRVSEWLSLESRRRGSFILPPPEGVLAPRQILGCPRGSVRRPTRTVPQPIGLHDIQHRLTDAAAKGRPFASAGAFFQSLQKSLNRTF